MSTIESELSSAPDPSKTQLCEERLPRARVKPLALWTPAWPATAYSVGNGHTSFLQLWRWGLSSDGQKQKAKFSAVVYKVVSFVKQNASNLPWRQVHFKLTTSGSRDTTRESTAITRWQTRAPDTGGRVHQEWMLLASLLSLIPISTQMKHVEGAGRASCDPVQTHLDPWELEDSLWNSAPARKQFCSTKDIRPASTANTEAAQAIKTFHSKYSRNKCTPGINTVHSELNVSSHARKTHREWNFKIS